MINVTTAVRHLESLYLDEFKSTCFDKENRREIILDLHSYFKYQVRVYTFSVENHIPKIYTDLRLGKISEEKKEETVDTSYPLNFLTELSQRLIISLQEECEEYTEPFDIMVTLSEELADILTLHGIEQDYIKDEYYSSTIDASEWKEILCVNPWLLVGILIKYTSYELIENMYTHRVQINEILKELQLK